MPSAARVFVSVRKLLRGRDTLKGHQPANSTLDQTVVEWPTGSQMKQMCTYNLIADSRYPETTNGKTIEQGNSASITRRKDCGETATPHARILTKHKWATREAKQTRFFHEQSCRQDPSRLPFPLNRRQLQHNAPDHDNIDMYIYNVLTNPEASKKKEKKKQEKNRRYEICIVIRIPPAAHDRITRPKHQETWPFLHPQSKQHQNPAPNAIYTTAATQKPKHDAGKIPHHPPSNTTTTDPPAKQQSPPPQPKARSKSHPKNPLKQNLTSNLTHLNIQPASIITT